MTPCKLSEAEAADFAILLYRLADYARSHGSNDLEMHARRAAARVKGVPQRSRGEQRPQQLEISFPRQSVKRLRAARSAVYAFGLVEKAREMRDKGRTYADIADDLNARYGAKISLWTVRDWVHGYYRAGL